MKIIIEHKKNYEQCNFAHSNKIIFSFNFLTNIPNTLVSICHILNAFLGIECERRKFNLFPIVYFIWFQI